MSSVTPSQVPLGEPASRSGNMFTYVLRLVFVLAFLSVGMSFVAAKELKHADLVVLGFAVVALVVIALDLLIPRKSLAAISGLFFGLIVGMVIAYGLSLIVDLIVEAIIPGTDAKDATVTAAKVGIGVICCYLSVSLILQTKDDIRFVIPYVEFAKQRKGIRPIILDTSVIVDGRIADISETWLIESEVIVPRFVLQELQTIADSGDRLKRTRGRRGLDMLNKLQGSERVEINILEVAPAKGVAGAGVDEMLIDLAVELNGKIVTTDYNLNKVAQLRGVNVININDLANALKPVVLPGEAMAVKIIKPGEEAGQGVGYLEDGTMVVVEGARERIGQIIDLTVTSVLQTSAGRMIFGRTEGSAPVDRRPHRSGQPSAQPQPPQSQAWQPTKEPPGRPPASPST